LIVRGHLDFDGEFFVVIGGERVRLGVLSGGVGR